MQLLWHCGPRAFSPYGRQAPIGLSPCCCAKQGSRLTKNVSGREDPAGEDTTRFGSPGALYSLGCRLTSHQYGLEVPRTRSGIREINSVDFSAVLRIIGCKVQFGKGISGDRGGRGLLPQATDNSCRDPSFQTVTNDEKEAIILLTFHSHKSIYHKPFLI